MGRRKALFLNWHEPILRLYPIGDVHSGAASHRDGQAQTVADTLAGDKYGLGIGLGDWIEAIAPSDKRFDVHEMSKPIEPEHLNNVFYCQTLSAVKRFEKTKGKWIAHILGNHELTAVQRYFFNPTPLISERLGGKYIGATDCSGWIVVRMMDGAKARNIVKIYVTHGYGGGELIGGQALRLQRLLMRKQADIVIVGHGHKPIVFPETVEYVDKAGYEREFTRIGVECFAFVGKHGYIARGGGNASPSGFTTVEIELQKSHLDARISADMRLF